MMHKAGQSIIVSLMRLIHITDPHLSTLEGLQFRDVRGKRRSGYLSWYKNRRFEHRRDILDRLTEAVQQMNPDKILVGGDLIHIGLEREMVDAGRWLRSLGPPGRVILVPGNHDNYAKDSLAPMYRHWGDYLPDPGDARQDYTAGFPFTHLDGPVRITGINSSCVTRIFSARGELGSAQLDRLNRSIDETKAEQNIHCLLLHHPPVPGISSRRKALSDDESLAKIIARWQPQLVLYGHIHRNREDRLGESRLFCTASASSAENASFRVFDLGREGAAWHCRMRLVTLDGGEFNSGPGQAWQIPVV